MTVDATGLLVAPGFVDLQCNGGLGHRPDPSSPTGLWELGGGAAPLGRHRLAAHRRHRAPRARSTRPSPRWPPARPRGGGAPCPSGCTSRARSCRRPSGARTARSTCAAPTLDGDRRVVAGRRRRRRDPRPRAARAPTRCSPRSWRGAWWCRSGHSGGHGRPGRGRRRRRRPLGDPPLQRDGPPPPPRAPGLAGVALADERVHVGLIADGVHVAPGRRWPSPSGPSAAAPHPRHRRRRGARDARRARARRARLADGTLAGSDLGDGPGGPQPRGLLGLHARESRSSPRSTAPAAVLGDPSRGSLAAGLPGRRRAALPGSARSVDLGRRRSR